MNSFQLARANKAHEGYLRLMAKRKNPEAFKPEPALIQKVRAKSRWTQGGSIWIPSKKAEGKILEATQDVLGDWSYCVTWWGKNWRNEEADFTEDKLEDLTL